MNTFVLNSETADETVKSLLDRLNGEDLRICDEFGQVLAYVKAPDEETARMERAYEWALKGLEEDRELLDRRSKNKGGITTEELCRRIGIPFFGRR